MRSRTCSRFKKAYDRLPKEIRQQTDKALELFKNNNRHPGLKFKRVGHDRYSINVSRKYRVVGDMENDSIVWFWVGKHEEYERVIRSRRLRAPRREP